MKVVSERTSQGGNAWFNDDFPREGAFDPATVTGYLRTPDGRFEFRLIAGILYAKALSDPFVRAEGTFEGMPIRLGHLGKDGITSADPQQLVTTLRESNATITQPLPNVYHYSMTKPPQFNATLVVDGDITLDAGGRIAKVTCTITATSQTGLLHLSRMTIELWDYGVPVQVETPAGAKPATGG